MPDTLDSPPRDRRRRQIPGLEVTRHPSGWVAVHYHYSSHPEKTPEWAEELAKTYPGGIEGSAWKAEMEIDFGARYGRHVYIPPWSDQTHVIRSFDIPPSWPRFRSIDPGRNNPCACLWGALSPEGKLYIYREFYREGLTVKQAAQFIRALSAGETIEWTVIDPSAAAERMDSAESIQYQFTEEGIVSLKGDNRIEDGIANVATWMMIDDDGRPRILVFEECYNFIREVNIYRYPKLTETQVISQDEKTRPIKKDDHCMDALRYMVQSCPDLSSGARRMGHSRRTFAQKVWAHQQKKLQFGTFDSEDLSQSLQVL